MHVNALPYALALAATAIITAGLALYAFPRRAQGPHVTTFAALLVAATWLSASAALEVMAPTIGAKVIGAKMKLAGMGALGPLWLAFALRYTRRDHWLTWPTRVLMALPSLVGFLYALTNESHHQVWAGFALDPTSPALIVTGYGPAYWAFLAAQYAFILAAAAVYLSAYLQAAPFYRQQIRLMVAGALVPLVGNAIYLSGVYPVRGLDLTPFSFVVSAVFLATGLFRFGLLDVQPIAARVVFNHLRDPVLVLDSTGRVVDLNSAARQFFGPGEAVIGQPMPALLQEAEASFEPTPGQAWPELQVGAGDARRWYRLEFSPLRAHNHAVVGRVALLVDVTGERLLAQLRNDLTHMLIHDLSNPLAAVQMALEMLPAPEAGRGPAALGQDALDAIGIIRRSNLRAQRLVSALLDIGRLEDGSMPLIPAALAPAEVAGAIVADMQPLAQERQLDLTLEAAAAPPVSADIDLLERVLRNLIGNAIKYTPQGGQVRVRVEPARNGAPDGAGPHAVVFAVCDTGPGLPPYVQQRLFQKFVRGPGPQRGHGLGLAFCKLAVEAMGGRIWAESQPQRGAAFYIALAAASGDQ